MLSDIDVLIEKAGKVKEELLRIYRWLKEKEDENAELKRRLAIADALLCRVVDESGRTYEQGDPVRGVAPRFSLVFPAGDELWGSLKIYRNGLLNASRAEAGRGEIG